MNKRLKEKYAAFKAKTAHMTMKEKLIDYIWEYYKFHILAALVLIYLIGGFVNSAFINPPKKPFAAIAFYDDYVSIDTAIDVEAALTEAIVPEELSKRQSVMCYPFTINSRDPEVSSANQMKFVAMITAKDLDIFIGGKDSLPAMFKDGLFEPLRNIFSEEELDALSEHLLIEGITDELNATKVIAAIDLSALGAEVLEPLGYSCENTFAAVIRGGERAENAKAVLKYLIGNELNGGE